MVNDDGNIVEAEKMPSTDRDILDMLTAYTNERHTSGLEDQLPPNHAVLEFVRSSPQMGVKSSFTFGQGYGGLKMALTAARIPYIEVTPQKWQGAMSCRTKGDKNITKSLAQQMFPSIKVTHAIADALLIAEFCRRQWVKR